MLTQLHKSTWNLCKLYFSPTCPISCDRYTQQCCVFFFIYRYHPQQLFWLAKAKIFFKKTVPIMIEYQISCSADKTIAFRACSEHFIEIYLISCYFDREREKKRAKNAIGTLE